MNFFFSLCISSIVIYSVKMFQELLITVMEITMIRLRNRRNVVTNLFHSLGANSEAVNVSICKFRQYFKACF